MSSTTIVTPTLVVGEVPAELQDAYRATTTGEAIQLVNAGLVAVLPDGAWDLAEDVLRAVIADHAVVLQVLDRARRGRLTHVQCNCPSCLAGLTRSRRRPNGALIWYDEPAGPPAEGNQQSGLDAPG